MSPTDILGSDDVRSRKVPVSTVVVVSEREQNTERCGERRKKSDLEHNYTSKLQGPTRHMSVDCHIRTPSRASYCRWGSSHPRGRSLAQRNLPGGLDSVVTCNHRVLCATPIKSHWLDLAMIIAEHCERISGRYLAGSCICACSRLSETSTRRDI